jgi:hypothetical protein
LEEAKRKAARNKDEEKEGGKMFFDAIAKLQPVVDEWLKGSDETVERKGGARW